MAEPARASLLDSARVAGLVVAPILAQGVIRRRPAVAAFAERFDLNRRGVLALRRLRSRYGSGPLLLRIPGVRLAVPFEASDVRAALAATPEPFAAATREKRAALGHFQPHGLLVTREPELRAARRSVNEAVLDTHSTLHRLGPALTRVFCEEADALLDKAGPVVVPYADYAAAFWRAVRRATLGDEARDDEEVTDVLDKLRDAANWAYARPPRPRLRSELDGLLRRYVDRAEPGSLAAEVAQQSSLPGAERLDPAGQMPQWLFAFDAAAIASAGMLALFATHPAETLTARRELGDRDLALPQYLPYLRGALHESVRLWPTTLVVLRETTSAAALGDVTLPERTQLLVVSAYHHRDPATVPHADRFAPEVWTDRRDDAAPGAAVIPFSDGPGRCPGENLVLLTATTFAGRLLQRAQVQLNGTHGLVPGGPLPGTLNPFGLAFRLTPRF